MLHAPVPDHAPPFLPGPHDRCAARRRGTERGQRPRLLPRPQRSAPTPNCDATRNMNRGASRPLACTHKPPASLGVTPENPAAGAQHLRLHRGTKAVAGAQQAGVGVCCAALLHGSASPIRATSASRHTPHLAPPPPARLLSPPPPGAAATQPPAFCHSAHCRLRGPKPASSGTHAQGRLEASEVQRCQHLPHRLIVFVPRAGRLAAAQHLSLTAPDSRTAKRHTTALCTDTSCAPLVRACCWVAFALRATAGPSLPCLRACQLRTTADSHHQLTIRRLPDLRRRLDIVM